MATLQLKFKNTVLQEYPITKSPIMIGREHNNDIVIDNLSVSRYHVKIQKEEDDYIVEDLDSGNGSLLNDKKLTRDTLRDRDEISVGKHTIIFLNTEENDIVQGEEVAEMPLAEQTFLLNAKALPDIMALRSDGSVKDEHVDVKDKTANRQVAKAHKANLPNGKPTDQEKTILEVPEVNMDGEIELISQHAFQSRIQLAKRTTFGGKSDKADIKLRGFLVGGIAFIISKKKDGFYITHSEGMRKTKVNGVSIRQPSELKDGFIITVGPNKMRFHLANTK